MKTLIFAASLALTATCANAQSQCLNREHLGAFLREVHDLRLHSWGLNDRGHMEELYLNQTGHWAVVLTTPEGCTTLASFPHKERGRLSPQLFSKRFPAEARPQGLGTGNPS
ncbi:hypothetical protein ACFQXB_06140 [Plastorhodobacter daqingensis]|uniref:Uncharacterized protein n=1 Tax=Plastorhodobacter daqingensis TaxID=1387281 RepID=A0ABW2UHW1_9RHOB